MSAEPQISLANINKSYYHSNGDLLCSVLKDLSFTLAQGEKAAFTGPSGSGKTTLLNIIGSLDTPDSGEVIIDSKNILTKTENERVHYRNRKVGFIFQKHYLLYQFTVLENILLPCLAEKKETSDSDLERAETLLEQLAIKDKSSYYPSMLSGGEMQRVSFARAMINSPKLILADEPTGSLDEKNSQILIELLISMAEQEKKSLIVVTHSQETAAYMDTEYSLNNGILFKKRS